MVDTDDEMMKVAEARLDIDVEITTTTAEVVEEKEAKIKLVPEEAEPEPEVAEIKQVYTEVVEDPSGEAEIKQVMDVDHETTTEAVNVDATAYLGGTRIKAPRPAER